MKLLKKTLVTLAGGALLLAGIAMVMLPGPAFVVIPVALAILAVEFVWARRFLTWLRERLKALAPSRSANCGSHPIAAAPTSNKKPFQSCQS